MNQKRKKILYIEDDPDARALMGDIIRHQGYIYIEAGRGLEGIRLAKQHKPDLILVDLMLPDMQGSEVTTHLKSLPELKNTPIIALTGATQKNVREYVLAAGCDGYISKPINVNEFIFKLEEFLAGKRESVPPEFEKEFLQRYNLELVQRLKRKVTELESLNKNLSRLNTDLIASREELARYNDLLFYLNSLANYLRTLNDPQKLLDVLPKKIVEGLQVERCVLFHHDPGKKIITPCSSYGNFNGKLRQVELPFSKQLLKLIRAEGGLLWIKDSHQLIEDSLQKIGDFFQSSNFILSYLQELGRQDLHYSFEDKEAQEEVGSHIKIDEQFVVYIDKNKNGEKFATYEIRILKSFLQSVAVIYENMQLFDQLKNLYKIKSEEAIRDGLTNVFNYRYFIRELKKEVARTKRYKTPFTLLMLDIDFFKKYNDLHGHVEGDNILKAISRLLKLNTRSTDVVARYGGEEFAIILPGITKEEALPLAEKLRTLIKNYPFPDKIHSLPCELTISIGVASCPEDSDDPIELVKMADSALYRAKQSGRDRVCVFKSEKKQTTASSKPLKK